MANQLTVYNEALRVLGETRLTSLAEMRPVRMEFNEIWDNDGLEACLSHGMWNFAAVSSEISYDPDVTPAFGYAYAFSLPDDYVRIIKLCSDEYMRNTVGNYEIEGRFVYADLDVIYLQYVSKHSAKGLDPSTWPALFATYVAHYFANKVKNIYVKDSKRRSEISKETRNALLAARNFDAMNQPSLMRGEGQWSSARRGNTARSDRGSRSNLIG